jgi:UDP-N-acetylglucosamine 3-dehydrogenase
MASLTRNIGVAVIGTRFGNLHAEAISEHPDRARVVAVCSRTEAHAGVLLMVSLNQRFLGHHQRAKALVDSGAIGDLFLCQSQFLGFSPIKGWRHDAAQTGGGVLIDSGMHKIDLLRWIAGEVTSVQALTGCYTHTAMEGEDTAVVLLRFASGAIGQVVSSWGVKRPVREESLMLAGAGGTIWTENATLSLTAAIEDAPGEIRQAEQETFPDVTIPDSVKRTVTHFLDCIQTETSPLITPEDGREALRIAQAAYDAVRTGQRIDL